MAPLQKINDISNLEKDNFTEELEAIYTPPSFTLKEIRDAIPAHLFERSLLKSTAYLVVNLLVCGGLFSVASLIDKVVPYPLTLIAWPTYWWYQGVALTGLWIIAHECGHGAFSDYTSINNSIGLILHSFLYCPYHPWRISHAHHHGHTGHMGEDLVYIPKRRSEVKSKDKEPSAWVEALQTSPIYVNYLVLQYLLLGWPAYLINNTSGGPKYQGTWTSHFSPSSPLFTSRQRGQVLLSDAVMIAFGALTIYGIQQTSLWTMSSIYIIPCLMVNAWVVCITLLHHTDVYIPHYSPGSWNYVRGALTTVDRDFGWFLNHALYHIQDSHVCHHLFSGMPHYNAIKATPYIKAKLGDYYYYDQTPIWQALYRATKDCIFVEDEGDVLFYKKK